MSKDGDQLIFFNLKPKEYKTIKAMPDYVDKDDPDGSPNIDTETKSGSDEIFHTKTVDQKNEMLIKEQIGEDKWDERMQFTRDPSSASCSVQDITSFIYGGASSRFWLMRKHINSLQVNKLKDLPFYSWECISLITKSREINLVIKNEKDMQNFLEFLIISLRTLNGERDSAMRYFQKKAGVEINHKGDEGFFASLFCTARNRKVKRK